MKQVACLILMILWCHATLSAESTDADTQRRSHALMEHIKREPPRSRETTKAYVSSIRNAIERHLTYPPGSGGQRCVAAVTQDKSGQVLKLVLSDCETPALASAVQSAIHAASPLPLPSDMRYFERNLHLVFVAPEGR